MDEKKGLFCPNCGMLNASSSKFCIKCGTDLPKPGSEEEVKPESEDIKHQDIIPIKTEDEKSENLQESVEPKEEHKTEQPLTNSLSALQETAASVVSDLYQLNNSDGKFNYFKYIAGVLLRPYDKYVSEEKNLSDIKNLSILGGIIVGILTLVRLLTTMLSYVRIKSVLSNEITWAWDNLIEVPYFKTFFISVFMYAGIILAVAGVYYLGGMIIKRDIKFIKLLGISLTAFIPYAAGTAILYPLLSMIYVPLGLVAIMIGVLYSVLSLIELINDSMSIDIRGIRIYFHLACLSIIMTIAVFIVYKIVLASLLGL